VSFQVRPVDLVVVPLAGEIKAKQLLSCSLPLDHHVFLFIYDFKAFAHTMQNRQKDELVRDIMSVCNGGAQITKVMFHAYVTHKQVKFYLTELIDKGLVTFDSLTRLYCTTPKGLEYLATIERMAELLPVATRRSVASERPFG
jgi:predicted transcriptional regulator